MKTIVQLRTAFFPPYMNTSELEERTKQFETGIGAFLQWKDILDKHGCNVYLLDNTIRSASDVPSKIAEMLKANRVKVVCFPDNRYGSINKGAGEVGGLVYMANVISQYDWLIHFEPRQQLQSFQFINSFLENPRNLFTINEVNKVPPNFNTGLYASKTSDLLKFLSHFTDERLAQMVQNRECLEHLMYNFYTNNTDLHILDKMDLIWLDPSGQKYHW